MNVTDYTNLLNKPEAINEKHTDDLTTVLNEFPYFQSARALRLKGLHNANSFKYNYALKVTAAYTTDRSVLFDFVTSEHFISMKSNYLEKKELNQSQSTIIDSELIVSEIKAVEEPVTINPIEKLILNSIQEADSRSVFEKTKKIEEKLEIGKPIDFSQNEKHSFQEWLKLSRALPIEREKEIEVKKTIELETKNDSLEEEKKKKAKTIDKFIETNPKISPVKSAPVSNVQIDINKDDNSYLMTETLARVYLEQKKYTKAIQAYQILILKYPEKISFFADRISDIKIVQQNNNNN